LNKNNIVYETKLKIIDILQVKNQNSHFFFK
jgi:hypothetical protein